MTVDENFMRQALDLAQEAYSLGEVPIGAVVVRNDIIIGQGFNRRETWHDPTAHAEILAIRSAAKHLSAWRLTGCTLYVTIEPCAMCAGALILGRLDRLVYGALDHKAGAIDSVFSIVTDERLNHRMEVTSGVLEEECSAIMRSFFRSLRK